MVKSHCDHQAVEPSGSALARLRRLATEIGCGALILVVLGEVPFIIFLNLKLDWWSLEVKVPGADLTIWLWAISLLLGSLVFRDRSDSPPSWRKSICVVVSLELLSFVAVAAVSSLASPLDMSALRGLVQLVDYFVLWYWIVGRSARRDRFLDRLGWTLPLLFLALVSVAAIQLLTGAPVFLIRSLFHERQDFLAYVVMIAPVVWCQLTSSPHLGMRVGGHLFVACGAAVTYSLGTMALLIAQLGAVAWLAGPGWLRRSGWTVGALLQLLLILFLSPYGDGLARQARDVFSAPMAQRRIEVTLAKYEIGPLDPLIHLEWGSWGATVASDVTHRLPRPTRSNLMTRFEPPIAKSSRVPVGYFAECWSALTLIANGPVLGRGWTNWQHVIGTAYGTLERTDTAFPNTSNGYLFVGVTIGGFGLMAWCLELRKSLVRAHRRAAMDGSARSRTFAAGCWGGLAGGAAFMFVCPIVSQPIVVYWVLLAASIHGMPFRSK